MSETIRTYSGSGGFSLSRPRKPKRVRWIILALVLVLGGYVLWIVRDTHPAEAFLEGGQRMHIMVQDVAARRETWSQSPIWQMLPEDHWLADVHAVVAQDIALPEWVLKNVVGRRFLISGGRGEENAGLVFVTRMTPVGVLLERLNRFSPRVGSDAAGGLDLLHLPNEGLYYAVRGRILVLSPSRRALITALTLGPGERVDMAQVDANLYENGAEDVRGTVLLQSGEPFGRFFESLSFSIRVDADRVQARLDGVLREPWQDRLAPLLPEAEPAQLLQPPGGAFAVSARLAADPESAWEAVAALLGGLDLDTPVTAANWRYWNHEMPEDSAARVMTRVLAGADPEMAFAWDGFDLDAEAPCPRIRGFVQPGAGFSIEDYTDTSGEGPPIVRLPLHRTPSAGWRLRAHDAYLQADFGAITHPMDPPAAIGRMNDAGHVLLRWNPRATVEALTNTGRHLKQDSLLTSSAAAAFDETVSDWERQWGALDEVRALFTHDEGVVHIDLQVSNAAR